MDMPGTSSLTFGEFIAGHQWDSSQPVSTVWSDETTINAWNAVRSRLGSAIQVTAGFAYPWFQIHGIASQHYAGKAFDGVPYYRTLSALYNAAEDSYQNTTVVNYVEPLSQSINHVHWDNRAQKDIAGYPQISQYDMGVYVMTMQYCLGYLRQNGYFKSGSYSYEYGIYDTATVQLVKDYQRSQGLIADGICGKNTWSHLNTDAYNAGKMTKG